MVSVCSTENVRSMPLVVQRSLFFTLEDLRYEEPATEAGRALAWPFFFGLRTVFVSRSDRRRKESKQTPVFVRSLDRRKQKKKSSSALDTRSKIDQTQGRASRAIDQAPAPKRPRLRYDLRNRRPGSPWLEQTAFQHSADVFRCIVMPLSDFDIAGGSVFSLASAVFVFFSCLLRDRSTLALMLVLMPPSDFDVARGAVSFWARHPFWSFSLTAHSEARLPWRWHLC